MTCSRYRCCLAGCRRQGVLFFVYLILALPLLNILSSFFISFDFSFSEFLSYFRFCRAFPSTCSTAHSLSDSVHQTPASVPVLKVCSFCSLLFTVCRLPALEFTCTDSCIKMSLFSGRPGIILVLEWLSCMLHTQQQFLEYCLLSRTTLCVYN